MNAVLVEVLIIFLLLLAAGATAALALTEEPTRFPADLNRLAWPGAAGAGESGVADVALTACRR